jgi:hypothetical protein
MQGLPDKGHDVIANGGSVTLLNLSSRENQSSVRLSFRSSSQILSPLLLALLCIDAHDFVLCAAYLQIAVWEGWVVFVNAIDTVSQGDCGGRYSCIQQ